MHKKIKRHESEHFLRMLMFHVGESISFIGGGDPEMYKEKKTWLADDPFKKMTKQNVSHIN